MARPRLSIPIIEFLKNRIYLGAYDYTPQDTSELVYFTVDDALVYNAFHLDFGPLHLGSLYRFAVVLHNILNEDVNQGKAVVFYSGTSPKERTNAACLLACYMVLVQSWQPHQVLQPLSQVEVPFQGFRDAGYSTADFEITIQDVVYAMWRAKERGMVDLTQFNLEEYEQYERVDQGDLNVISSDFIAFALPQQSLRRPLNEPFRKVLGFFAASNVQLVVRLNSHLYDASEFTKRGINHIDMIFEDGTCPTLDYVRRFIGAAECVIARGGKVAVHCKAGLGRTGCLIGAHLIYTHGFTASECIAYMRMVRPGMVVGPQQHWLYLHQHEFRDWRHTMCVDTMPDPELGGLSLLVPLRRKLPRKTSNIGVKLRTAVPSESPGQPRKHDVGNNSDDDIMLSGKSMNDSTHDTNKLSVHEYDASIHDINRVSVHEVRPMGGQDISFYDTSVHNSIEDIGEVNTADGRVLRPEWKVLRSISTNSNSPVMTKTTTTTTTRTVSTTLTPTSPGGSRLPRSRSGNKLALKNGSRVLSGAVRKVSGKKY